MERTEWIWIISLVLLANGISVVHVSNDQNKLFSPKNYQNTHTHTITTTALLYYLINLIIIFLFSNEDDTYADW